MKFELIVEIAQHFNRDTHFRKMKLSSNSLNTII